MAAPKKTVGQPAVLVDEDFNEIDSVFIAGVRRLAVDASITASEIQIGAVELDDGEFSTRAMVKGDGAPVSAAPNDGGLLIAGFDDVTPAIRHIRVNASGQLIAATTFSVGATITSPAHTAVGALATVALPVPAAGTTQLTVQNVGPAGSEILVRELGGLAGSGFLLPRFSVRTFDRAVASLEAEEITGNPTTVGTQEEGP